MKNFIDFVPLISMNINSVTQHSPKRTELEKNAWYFSIPKNTTLFPPILKLFQMKSIWLNYVESDVANGIQKISPVFYFFFLFYGGMNFFFLYILRLRDEVFLNN